jgi:hypothetical protein
MVVCSVVIESETVFISVFNWLLNTNLYPDVTNLSLKRLSTTQIQLDFVPFDLTPLEFYCTLF